jgi:hypothetical protein
MRSTTATTPNSDSGPGALFLGAIRGWDRFWFSPQDPTTLCWIRLCAGLVVLYVHLTYSWQLLSYVGPEAWIDKIGADYIIREAPVNKLDIGWDDTIQEDPYQKGNYYWSIYYHVTSPGWIIAIHVFFLTAMLLFALGLWTRYTAALSWAGAICYVHRASSTVFGLDTMMMIVLLYLLIGPSGAVLSLDRWWKTRQARLKGEEPEEVKPSLSANFAIRLIQVHFCVIYFAAGTSKLLGSTWWSGTALNLVMLNPEFAPMDYGPYFHFLKFLATHRWLWESFMAFNIVGTLFLELGFPFLVWDMRWRWAAICGAVLLHTGIALFMGLTSFSLIMLCMLCSFIPPEVVREQVNRLCEFAGRLLTRKADAEAASRDLVLTR